MGSRGGAEGPAPDPRVGLCSSCRHARVQESRRSGAFWRCLKAEDDPGWPRYPKLPVPECAGFEAGLQPDEPDC